MSRAEHTECTCTLPYIVDQPSASHHPSAHTQVSSDLEPSLFPNFGAVISTEKLPTCLGNCHVTLSVQLILQHPWGVRFMGGDTSSELWALWKADSPDCHKHLIIETKKGGIILMTVLEQGSFCIWNCINKRCLNYEAVILPRLQRRVSDNIKPLNQRAVPVPGTRPGKSIFPSM